MMSPASQREPQNPFQTFATITRSSCPMAAAWIFVVLNQEWPSHFLTSVIGEDPRLFTPNAWRNSFFGTPYVLGVRRLPSHLSHVPRARDRRRPGRDAAGGAVSAASRARLARARPTFSAITGPVASNNRGAHYL